MAQGAAPQPGYSGPLSGVPLGLTQGTLPEGWLESFLANLKDATPIAIGHGLSGQGGLSLSQLDLPEGWLESFLANMQHATPITIGQDGLVLTQASLPEGWLENVLAHVTANPLAGNALPDLNFTSHAMVMSDVELVGVPHTIEGFQQMIA